MDGWTETPVDVLQSQGRVELDVLSLKDGSLSDRDSVGGSTRPPRWLLGIPYTAYIQSEGAPGKGIACAAWLFRLEGWTPT